MSVSASWLDPITNFDLSTSAVVTEAIWDNVMSNLEYVGAAVEPDTLVNRSGGQRAAGDVVIADVSNDRSFTTTTVASDVRVIGVVMDTVANGASGRIGTAGVVNVKMHTPITRGNFIAAGSTAGYAKDIGASKIEGSFGISLSTVANGASASVPVLLKTSMGGGRDSNLRTLAVDGVGTDIKNSTSPGKVFTYSLPADTFGSKIEIDLFTDVQITDSRPASGAADTITFTLWCGPKYSGSLLEFTGTGGMNTQYATLNTKFLYNGVNALIRKTDVLSGPGTVTTTSQIPTPGSRLMFNVENFGDETSVVRVIQLNVSHSVADNLALVTPLRSVLQIYTSQ